MSKPPTIRQRDASDCGPACLASVCAHFRINVSVARLRIEAGTDSSGTTVSGLLTAATAAGLQAKAFHAPPEALAEFQVPFIAHIRIRDERLHYVVVFRVTDQNIHVMDPAGGKYQTLSVEDFNKQWTGIVVVAIPGGGRTSLHSARPTARLGQLVTSQWQTMLPSAAAAVIVSLIGLLPAFAVRDLFDVIIPENNTHVINVFAITLLLALAVESGLSFWKDRLMVKTSERLLSMLVTNYYQKLFRLPQSFFDTMRTGELISRLSDAARVSGFIARSFAAMILNTLVIVFSSVIIIVHSITLAVLIISAVTVFAILLYVSDRFTRKKQELLVVEEANFDSTITELLHASGTVKRLGMESFAGNSLTVVLNRMLNRLQGLQHQQVATAASALFFTRVLAVSVLWIGGFFVVTGRMSTGELISSYGLLIYFTAPMIALLGSVNERREALIAAERLFEITDLEDEVHGTTRPPHDSVFPVTFERACFRYRNGPFVLKGFTLQINEGEIVGIKGESGSGKSTIAALLQGLYPLQEGQIRINGIPVNDFDRKTLRSAISCVPQQHDIFTGTVVENIAPGDAHPDMDRIDLFAQTLCLAPLIDRLVYGWHTVISGDGNSLSGGEKQKICIARALYKKPRLLILDEATSALDAATEIKIMQTFEKYRAGGNSIIIIAHRPSALTICDKIIMLESGCVK